MGTFERQVRVWGQTRSCPGEICCSVPLCLQLFLHVGQSTELEAEAQTFKIGSVPFSTRQPFSQVCSGWLWQWQSHTMTSGSQDAQEGSLECVISARHFLKSMAIFRPHPVKPVGDCRQRSLRAFWTPMVYHPSEHMSNSTQIIVLEKQWGGECLS